MARATQTSDGQWGVDVLLASQDVRCLTADPLRKNVVYAGTQGNGVLRSDDGGKSLPVAGMHGQIVKALAASSHEPNVIYAGTKPTPTFSDPAQANPGQN